MTAGQTLTPKIFSSLHALPFELDDNKHAFVRLTTDQMKFVADIRYILLINQEIAGTNEYALMSLGDTN